MADAPEVVPIQETAPEVYSPNSQAPEVVPTPTLLAQTPSQIALPASPSPPYSTIASPDIIRNPTDTSNNRSEKSAAYTSRSPPPQIDRTTPKLPMEEQDRMTAKYLANDADGNGTLASQSEGTLLNPNSMQAQSLKGLGVGDENGAGVPDDAWHFGFWDVCAEPSLACECITCPCILAGRTHQRVKGKKDSELGSTSVFCFSCCFCTLILPFTYFIFTSTTRREVRYKYHIKGSNSMDCLATGFCCPCACIQEERETRWREQQRVQSGDGGYGRRSDQMMYQKQ